MNSKQKSPNVASGTRTLLSTQLPAQKAAANYVPFPIKTSRDFRDLCLRLYPALETHQDGKFYWEMLQYVLFSQFEDEERRLIIPAVTVAALLGVGPNKRGFRAIDYIHSFSRDIFTLHNIRPHRYVDGDARTIDRVLPYELDVAFYSETENALWAGKAGVEFEMVWFVSGIVVTPSKQARLLAQKSRELQEAALLNVAEDHPAYELMVYMNGLTQVALTKRIKTNWGSVMKAYEALPYGDKERDPGAMHRKVSCMRTLAQIDACSKVYYTSSDKTPRIYAMQSTVNQLPRHIRKIAFAGCVELDMRACQLAVVSKIWNLPSLAVFLGDKEKSIWSELQTSLGVGPEYKDLFKKAIYSIIFGMRHRNLFKFLLDGDNKIEGLGKTALVQCFFAHGLVAELLRERECQMKNIRHKRLVVDAFGRVIHRGRGMTIRSLMAQEVQSYELKMMLTVYTEIKEEKDAHIVSWLHDGITIWFTDKREEDRLIRRLTRKFKDESTKLGIPTELELNRL